MLLQVICTYSTLMVLDGMHVHLGIAIGQVLPNCGDDRLLTLTCRAGPFETPIFMPVDP